MDGTEFGVDDQYPGGGVGATDGVRHFHGGERRVAAHKPQVEAVHRRVQGQFLHQIEIEARSGESGAAHRNQVGNTRLGIGEPPKQRTRRLQRQPLRLGDIEIVSGLGGGFRFKIRRWWIEGVVRHLFAVVVDHGVAFFDRRGGIDPVNELLRP